MTLIEFVAIVDPKWLLRHKNCPQIASVVSVLRNIDRLWSNIKNLNSGVCDFDSIFDDIDQIYGHFGSSKWLPWPKINLKFKKLG